MGHLAQNTQRRSSSPDAMVMVGRSFDRRSELAVRRTNNPMLGLAGVDRDAEIESLVGRSRHADRGVVFATFRRLDGADTDGSMSFAPVVRIAAIDSGIASSVIADLDDGAVLCVIGMLKDRNDAHDLVDRLYVAVHGLERSSGGAVGIGFAIAEPHDCSVPTMVDRSRRASLVTSDRDPIVIFTPTMDDSARSGSGAVGVTHADGDPIVDLRGREPEEMVARVASADGERQALALRDAAASLPTLADGMITSSAGREPTIVWIEASTRDLAISEALDDFIVAADRCPLSVGLLFAEAAIASLGEVAVDAVTRLRDGGVEVGLREFTGRHLATHRLAELSLRQVTFATSFVCTLENGPALGFLRQLVAALRKLEIEPVLHGSLDDLGELPRIVDVGKVWLAPMGDVRAPSLRTTREHVGAHAPTRAGSLFRA